MEDALIKFMKRREAEMAALRTKEDEEKEAALREKAKKHPEQAAEALAEYFELKKEQAERWRR